MLSKSMVQKLNFAFIFTSICISVIAMIFGTILAMKGYRDVDTAFNIRNMQYQGILPYEMVDVSFTGKEYTVEEIYDMGLKEFMTGVILFILSFALIFPSALGYLIKKKSFYI